MAWRRLVWRLGLALLGLALLGLSVLRLRLRLRLRPIRGLRLSGLSSAADRGRGAAHLVLLSRRPRLLSLCESLPGRLAASAGGPEWGGRIGLERATESVSGAALVIGRVKEGPASGPTPPTRRAARVWSRQAIWLAMRWAWVRAWPSPLPICRISPNRMVSTTPVTGPWWRIRSVRGLGLAPRLTMFRGQHTGACLVMANMVNGGGR